MADEKTEKTREKSGVPKGTEAARKSSEEVLTEQAGMKPVPSQEDADKIKLGEEVNADADQPEGPASRRANTLAEDNAAADETANEADARRRAAAEAQAKRQADATSSDAEDKRRSAEAAKPQTDYQTRSAKPDPKKG